jgi:XRE family transcriptional regulator, aerobic/anaerobic benzoate catabolism transcriptional regulator
VFPLAPPSRAHANVCLQNRARIPPATRENASALLASAADLTQEQLARQLPPTDLDHAHKLLLEKFSGAPSALRRSRIALTGLRGAGKSTLGSLLARRLQWAFIELDRQIESDTGLTLSIIFDLYGQAG